MMIGAVFPMWCPNVVIRAVPGAPAPMQMQATPYRSNAVSNASNAHGSYGKPVGVQAHTVRTKPTKVITSNDMFNADGTFK